MPADLSIVIPTLGTREVLPRGLQRLGAQTTGAALEVIVAGDAAVEDPTGLRAQLNATGVEYKWVTGTRPGASSARNAGWSEATAPLVLFLDDDILATPDLVAQHLAWHKRWPADTVAVLGHVRWAPELAVTPFMRWLDQGIQFDYPNIEGVEAGWGRLYTANVSMKRALIALAGGFDEARLPFGYEDLDLGLRLDSLGMRLLYSERALADHVHPMDLDFWKQRVRRIAFAERRFVALHPEVEPYFHNMFVRAAARPPAQGRGRGLIGRIPRWVPWLGERVWVSADIYFKQQLAPAFLAAWDEEETPGAPADPAFELRARH